MSLDWPLVLAYHDIVKSGPTHYAVASEAFERRLGRMLADGFTPLSLDEALSMGAFGSRPARAKTFTLTFDDGLRSFGRLAFPALARLGLVGAATVFVPTAFVGGGNDWRGRARDTRAESAEPAALLDWDELDGLRRAGVSIQSHGHRHVPLHALSYDEALAEAATSRAELAGHGIDATVLALPYGWRSEACKEAIRDAGYEAALSVQWGGRDRFEIRRIPMYGTDGEAMMRLKLSGRFFAALDTGARLAGRRHESV